MVVQVTEVRHVGAQGLSQIEVGLTGPVSSYKTSLLGRDAEKGFPARAYVDLTNVRLAKTVAGAFRVDDPCVQQIRTGQFDTNVVRVVLDLKTSCEVKAALMTEPFRLVIDVRGEGSDSVRRTASVARALPRQRTVPAAIFGIRKIVLDPGHGGKDTGAIGAGGILEKDVVLRIAKKLARRLRSEMGIEVVLTREHDTFIPLEERTAIANKENADLFVSLHTNASPNPRVGGIETYYLNNTDDEAARRLAERENAGSNREISDIQYILSDLIQNSKMEDSIALAHHLHASLVKQAGRRFGTVKDLGVKQALFYVLVGARMPSVLAEMFFITNRSEARWLGGESYHAGIVEGLFQGIKQFAQRNPAGKSL
jgi:N-acetylmuramoyl-L-alanine amidase